MRRVELCKGIEISVQEQGETSRSKEKARQATSPPHFWGTGQVVQLSSAAQLIAQGSWSDLMYHLSNKYYV